MDCSSLPSPSLLRIISNEEKIFIQNKCNFASSIKVPESINFVSKPLPEQINFNWAAVIIEKTSLKIICSATFITSIHLITIKECVQEALKKNITRLSVIGAGFCYEIGGICKNKDVEEFDIDLIGWYNSEEIAYKFAIIQLIQHNNQNRISQACLLGKIHISEIF